MGVIEIVQKTEGGNKWEFIVTVHINEGMGFRVDVDKDYWRTITGERHSPEVLVHRSFQFLLKKEPVYLIYRKFNIRNIQEHFPDYEEEMKKSYKGLFSIFR